LKLVHQSFAAAAAASAAAFRAAGVVPQEELKEQTEDSPGIGFGQLVAVLVLSLGRGIGEEFVFASDPKIVDPKLSDD
jgi:hypothetical protein